VKRQLSHAADALSHLTELVRGADVLEQTNQEIENLVVGLKRDFFSINQKIEDIEQIRSPPPHLASLAKSLRRDLKAITSDFSAAMEERATKVERLLRGGGPTASVSAAKITSSRPFTEGMTQRSKRRTRF
jgi:ABC-type hemin transport system substrate-binding protein